MPLREDPDLISTGVEDRSGWPSPEEKSVILASNRGPFEYRPTEKGTLSAHRGQGGLVTALSGLASHVPCTWISSAITEGDRTLARTLRGKSLAASSE